MTTGCSRYEKEENLKKHYDSNLVYYSTNIDEILESIGYENIYTTNQNTFKVLDLGCGDGRACFKLAKKILNTDRKSANFQIVGVDYSQPRIDLANTKTNSDSIKFVCEDIHNYLDSCIENNIKFDLIIANEVIEHLENPREVVDKLKKISNWVVGTVPINLPYIAHLNVWKTVIDIKTYFNEFFVAKMGAHAILEWKN
jgi:2-polyprenyl-3-methyl-5-hydroxy-6-metoxy-1,4-benzoquinol methylase